jgi:quercetin dioxygenase-like cupin family protein
MELVCQYIADVAAAIPQIPADAIVSRTLYNDNQLKVILFGFAPGQELSEHTSARRAMLYFVRGDAALTLGQDAMCAQAGTFVHMPPHLPHSVRAHTEVLMLLLMVEEPR